MKSVRVLALLVALAFCGHAKASSSYQCTNTWTWPDQFQNYNYVTNWPPMMQDCLAFIGADVTAAQLAATNAINAAATATTFSATQGSSTTSLTVGTGTQSLTIQTGKGLLAGMAVRIVDQAAPTTNYMDGLVSSYNSGTGALVVTVTGIGGSGTKTAWNVFQEGPLNLPTLSNGHLLGNATGASAQAQDTTLTSLIDQAFGNVQGDILYRGASTWSVLAPGTAGQHLQTNGAGANPSFITPAWTQLGSQSGSGLSSISFSNVIGAAVNDVIVTCHGLMSSTSSGDAFFVQVGTGATPTWITSGYNYNIIYGQSSTLVGQLQSSVAGFQADSIGVTNTSPTGVAFTMEIQNLQNTQTSNIQAFSQSSYIALSGGAQTTESGAGYVASGAAAITSIRIFPSVNSFSGACSLYAKSGV